MRIGFHISISRGLLKALDEAHSLGCNTIQLFSRNPRGWSARPLNDNDLRVFSNRRLELDIHPLIVHIPYLPNFATPNKELLKRSVAVLMEELIRTERLGGDFLVTHIGRAKNGKKEEALQRVIDALNEALSAVDNSVVLLLENTAGGKNEVGSSFEELREIIEKVERKERIGICYDTAHGFQAGYDIRDERGVEELFKRMEKTVGLNRLRCVHLNDSKTEFASHIDRHWHIGKGRIGETGLRAFLNHPALGDIPVIMETPKKSPNDDAENIKTVFRLIGRE